MIYDKDCPVILPLIKIPVLSLFTRAFVLFLYADRRISIARWCRELQMRPGDLSRLGNWIMTPIWFWSFFAETHQTERFVFNFAKISDPGVRKISRFSCFGEIGQIHMKSVDAYSDIRDNIDYRKL